MRYILFLSILLLGAFNAQGQMSNTVSGTADIIASTMTISVTNLTGVVSFATSSDYSDGQAIDDAASITVKSSVAWLVTAAAQSANFSALGGHASTNMPASVLKLRPANASGYLTMSTTSQTFKTGSSGTTTFNSDVYLTPGFSYNDGTYSIGVVFTVTKQ